MELRRDEWDEFDEGEGVLQSESIFVGNFEGNNDEYGGWFDSVDLFEVY